SHDVPRPHLRADRGGAVSVSSKTASFVFSALSALLACNGAREPPRRPTAADSAATIEDDSACFLNVGQRYEPITGERFPSGPFVPFLRADATIVAFLTTSDRFTDGTVRDLVALD